MDSTEKTLSSVEKDIQYFDKMVDGAERLIRPWKTALIALIIGWFLTTAGFLLYLYQYDFVSSNEATGIYAMIDSNGNIVAQDVSPEQWEAFTKWWEVNGASEKNQIKD